MLRAHLPVSRRLLCRFPLVIPQQAALETRRVNLAGFTPYTGQEWMEQQARNMMSVMTSVREKVHPHQNVPVRADKVLPGDRLFSLRRWTNAVATEDVAHRLIG